VADTSPLWSFLLTGYFLTVLIEAPILLIGLSARHPLGHRLFAGLWLTACTYPIVILVLPLVFDPTTSRTVYLVAAETFAPVAECALFWAAFGSPMQRGKPSMWRDLAVVTAANLASFGVGEWLNEVGWWAGGC
jgi:hypothetical protein